MDQKTKLTTMEENKVIEYTPYQKEFQLERMVEDFYSWAEEQASIKEIAVDYFLAEFVCDC